MTLGMRELDKMGCAHEGHTAEACDNSKLFFHAACHPKSPTWSSYSEGTLTVECSVCHRPVVAIKVAE